MGKTYNGNAEDQESYDAGYEEGVKGDGLSDLGNAIAGVVADVFTGGTASDGDYSKGLNDGQKDR